MGFYKKLLDLEESILIWDKIYYAESTENSKREKLRDKQKTFNEILELIQKAKKNKQIFDSLANNKKITPICIRFLQYSNTCGNMFTQVELLSAGSYGRLGIPLNLMTMFVRFETWQLNSEEKPILSNVSNNIPPLPPADLRLVTDLINRYNNNQLQSNCQFRNLPDDDGWSSQKVVLHSANGPWYLIQKANVSVPPIITVSFDIKLVDLSSNLLKPKFIELINELISKDITPTYRECGDLPETLNINLPSIDDAGSSISTTTQTTIGNNIQNTIINSLKKSNIPTDGIVFTIAPNTVPFPSIIITSP